jgi:4-alpha-glucanotransferase
VGPLKAYANAKGVRIIGDICRSSSPTTAPTVWSHPDLYELDDDGQPTVVAGVPPD